MTVALHSIIREGREHDYDAEHRVVWPELAELLHDCGIDEWRIWRSGRNLFHLVDCDDFDASLAQLDASPLNQRWQDHINTIVDHFEPGPSGMAIKHVWSLSLQRADSAGA
jgi:L-rhamnose mutarotase